MVRFEERLDQLKNEQTAPVTLQENQEAFHNIMQNRFRSHTSPDSMGRGGGNAMSPAQMGDIMYQVEGQLKQLEDKINHQIGSHDEVYDQKFRQLDKMIEDLQR